MRTYLLHVPTGYTGKLPIPLIVDYHGLRIDQSGEKGISDTRPLAIRRASRPSFLRGSTTRGTSVPAVRRHEPSMTCAFTRALVKDVQSKVCVDPKRIYAVGYSMGGGMSHYLGCNAADLFAAIAPAAFDLLIASEEPCNPSRPITEITFRGTADPIVNL